MARRKPGYRSAGKSDHVIVAVNRVMTGEQRAWRKEEVAMRKSEPHTEAGNPARPSAGEGGMIQFPDEPR